MSLEVKMPFDWQQYHASVRQSIAAFDQLLTALWLQGFTFAGAAIAAVDPTDDVGATERRFLEVGALIFASVLFIRTWMFAALLKRAVEVGKNIEEKMPEFPDGTLMITQYLDKTHWGGGHQRTFAFNLFAAAVIPVLIAVLLVLDIRGKID